jgi:hypothetical protein
LADLLRALVNAAPAVSALTIATSSTVRGLPGLGRSPSPPIPPAAYRRFHKITVGLDAPVRRTISFVPIPSAASSTIRARRASPARIDGDRTQEASTSRSRGGTSTLTVSLFHPGYASWSCSAWVALAS